MNYKNKNIVITGGSTGIGFEMAKDFLSQGAKVLITGRNADKLELAKKKLGDSSSILKSDASSMSDIKELANFCKSHFKSIDALIVNAGIAEKNTFGETTEEHFDKIFDINVKGLFFTVQNLLPSIKEEGSIVLTASIVSFKGMPNLSLYNASKATVRSFARSLANDLKERKIRVNALSPGVTETPIMANGLEMGEADIQGFKDYLKEASPIGRMAHPSEISKAALFLCSQNASYVNGIEFCVDGGFGQI